MTSETQRMTGGCLCGAVRFQTDKQPQWISHCHCMNCRKMSGSPFSTGLMYRAEEIEWTGEVKSFESSPGILRVTCEKCGSYLAFRELAAPEKDVVLLGAFDDPSQIRVDANVNHIFAERELNWLHVADEFPRAEGLPGSLYKIK